MKTVNRTDPSTGQNRTRGKPVDVADLWSADPVKQDQAIREVIAITWQPVDWASDVWEDVLANLTHKD